jgi:hypothetical protein
MCAHDKERDYRAEDVIYPGGLDASTLMMMAWHTFQ